MKNAYYPPELNIISFESEDIIVTSITLDADETDII